MASLGLEGNAEAVSQIAVVGVKPGHDQSDGAGSAGAKAASGEVHLIVEFGNDLEHAQGCFGTNATAAVNHIRDRHHRNASLRGHIAHGGHGIRRPWSLSIDVSVLK